MNTPNLTHAHIGKALPARLLSMFVICFNVLFLCGGGGVLGQTPQWDSRMQQPGATFNDIRTEAENYFALNPFTGDEGAEESYQNFKRWEYFWGGRVDANDGFQSYGTAYYNYLLNKSALCNGTAVTSNWQQIGPRSLPSQNNGIVVSLAFDPWDATYNTAFAGTNSGGIWKGTNLKTNPLWIALQDANGFPGCGVPSIVVDPVIQNTIYIGTGTTTNYRGYGFGVFKSTDGGNTWTNISNGYFDNNPLKNIVRKLVMDRNNNQILWALTDNKVYYTNDAGSTWITVFTRPSCTGCPFGGDFYLMDLVIDPVNANMAYASTKGFGDINWIPQNTLTQDKGGQVFKIGVTGMPPTAITPVDITFLDPAHMSGSDYFNIGIETPDSDPGKVYIVYKRQFQTSQPTAQSITFSYPTKLLIYDASTSGYTNTPGLVVDNNVSSNFIVSASDNNVFYWGELVAWATGNKGVTASQISSYQTNNAIAEHADCRVVLLETATAQGANDVLWMGNDGGVSRRSNGTWTNRNGTGLDITQFYDIAVYPRPGILLGGTQDNSNFMHANGAWLQLPLVGDGGPANFNPNRANHYYNTANDVVQQVDASTFQNYNNTAWRVDESMILDPHDPTAKRYFIDAGTSVLMNNTASGNSITDISPPPPPAGPEYYGDFDISLANPDIMYLAKLFPYWSNPTPVFQFSKLDNLVAVKGGAAPNWIDLTQNITTSLGGINPFEFHSSRDVLVDPADENRLWICFANITNCLPCNNTNHFKVIQSADGGITWTNITHNLPDLPVNCLALDKTTNQLYAGTDGGVFILSSGSSTWQCFNTNLPNIIVSDLEINYCNNKIIAATFGRGIWQSPLPHAGYSFGPTPAITGPLTSCEINTAFTVTNAQPGQIIEWTAVTGTGNIIYNSTGTATSILVNFPDAQGGTVTCTFVDASTECGATATFTVNACCSTQYTLDGTVNVSTLDGSPYITITYPLGIKTYNFNTNYNTTNGTPFTIAINGNLVLDENTNFTNCEFLFGPNAVITVPSPPSPLQRILNVANSYLHTCYMQYQWQGIVTQGANCFVGTSSSIIEDANMGVFGAQNAMLSFTGRTIFNRNRIGVYVDRTTTAALFHLIQNCDFISVVPGTIGTTNTYSNLISPFAGSLGYAGVQLNDVADMQIGDDLNPVNKTTFKNLYCGILATTNSTSYANNLIVRNCTFTDMLMPQTQLHNGKGHGVYAFTGKPKAYPYNVTIGGNDFVHHTNTFTNCKLNGAKISGFTNADVVNNTFANSAGSDVYIENSYTTPGTPLVMNINLNIIDNYNTGIRVYRTGGSVVNINNNYFTGYDYQTSSFNSNAINLQNPVQAAGLYNIAFNFILGTRIGIYCNNATGITVNDNVISFDPSRTLYPGNVHKGIWMTACPYSTVNHLNQVLKPAPLPNSQRTNFTGFQFENCNNTLVQDNYTNYMGTGMRIYGNCDMLDLKCNQVGALVGYDVTSSSMTDQGVFNNPNPDYSWKNSWMGSYTTAYPKVLGAIAISRKWICFPPSLGFESIEPKSLSSNFAEINSNTTVEAGFYCLVINPLNNNLIGTIEEVASGEIDQQTTDENYKYLAKKVVFEAMKKDTAIGLDSIYNTLYISLASSNIGALSDVADELNEGNYAAALTHNNDIVDQNTIEYNKKTTNQYFLNNIITDIPLTETDSTWLNSTADLQPIQGGDATYDARAILFKEVHSQQQNLRQVNPSYLMSSIRSNEFKIKPNPASTHVNIEYGLFEDEKAVVLIYDALGKQMLIENLDNNYTSQSLDVSQFKQGVYSLIIKLGGSNLINKKLVLIK